MPLNIGDNRIVADGIARIRVQDARRLSRYLVRAGDIVYSRRGDVERRALVRKAEDGWLCGTGCLRVRVGRGVADPVYTSYYLGHPAVREWIVRHAVGATMPNLNTSILSALPFLLPSLPEQHAIAHILGTLDDKIELNRRMNETLEAMARAIFKSWFVDFDPVRARAAGQRVAGMDEQTTQSFPDRFEESPVGRIPAGWSVMPVGQTATIVGGATPSTRNPAFWGGPIRFATPRDLAGLATPVLLDTERSITQEGLQKISSGLLPKGTVLLSSRAPIGYLAIAEVPVAVNQGFIAMVCDGLLPNYYLLYWARHNMDTIVANANGTTFLEISKKSFRSIEIIVPPADVLAAFVEFVHPLYRRIVAGVVESRTLAAIRDALLPKLLSGEIRTQQVETLL